MYTVIQLCIELEKERMLTFKQLVNSYKHLLCKRWNYKEYKHKQSKDKVPSSNKQRPVRN